MATFTTAAAGRNPDRLALKYVEAAEILSAGFRFAEFTKTGEGWIPERLTWRGHDFADSVRDDEIWRKTKAGVEAAKGFTVDLLGALAKGFIKKQIEERTGISLDL